MSIPTLMVFKDGVAKKRIVGAKGKGQPCWATSPSSCSPAPVSTASSTGCPQLWQNGVRETRELVITGMAVVPPACPEPWRNTGL